MFVYDYYYFFEYFLANIALNLKVRFNSGGEFYNVPKIRIAEVERIARCIHFVKLVHVFNLLPFLHKQTRDVYNVQSSASACLGA